jgi:hypothetical protein
MRAKVLGCPVVRRHERVLFHGKEPADVKPGVPTDRRSIVRLSAAARGARLGPCSIRSGSWHGRGRLRKTIAVAELTY